MMAEQQGVHFDTQREADDFVRKNVDELQRMFRQNSELVMEGLRLLSNVEQRAVSELAKTLLEQTNAPAAFAKTIQTDVADNPAMLRSFSKAINSFYDCGDFHAEECVMAVFMALFPMEAQPYSCYGVMLWRRDGIEKAVDYYRAIVDTFKSPILDYYASECFREAGHVDDAKRVLLRAMKIARSDPEHYTSMMDLLESSMKHFN
jgi:tetratricopeptide (TPR) repeat protein